MRSFLGGSCFSINFQLGVEVIRSHQNLVSNLCRSRPLDKYSLTELSIVFLTFRRPDLFGWAYGVCCTRSERFALTMGMWSHPRPSKPARFLLLALSQSDWSISLPLLAKVCASQFFSGPQRVRSQPKSRCLRAFYTVLMCVASICSTRRL